MYFWRQLTFKSVCWVCSRLLLMALNLLVRCSWLHTLYPWFSLRNLRIIWSWIVWLLKIFDWTWSVCLKVFLSIDVFSFLPVFYASHLFYNFVQLLILMNEFLAHMLKLLISLFHLFLQFHYFFNPNLLLTYLSFYQPLLYLLIFIFDYAGNILILSCIQWIWWTSVKTRAWLDWQIDLIDCWKTAWLRHCCFTLSFVLNVGWPFYFEFELLLWTCVSNGYYVICI